ELIASNKTIKDIKEYIGLDSLKYLSLSGMLKSMPLPDSDFCTACFTGKYPTAVPEGISKDILEKGSPKIKGRAR
ncbi:MAG: amidophosphoribosyltransferase, partial [Candidatus Omnitrophica bacterium]|nr:amidophosphoribosyltransferase [Candidatus Omnitrophota bacterium]